MSKIVLANVDYRQHMTSEGNELQLGLEAAGWTLVGFGYGDGCRDVPTLLDRYKPTAVLISDKRDWDPSSTGAFRKDIGFTNLGALSQHADIFKVCVVKDAGGQQDYHRRFCEEVQAGGIVTYYHDRSVRPLNPWMMGYPTIRTYHSVDGMLRRETVNRKRAVVSGALSGVYPLRQMAVLNAGRLGLAILRHPGYSNRGSRTADYLKEISGYKVHVATASRFGFALRKIIESVLVGTTPVTDLPEYDVLPGIDKALVRVSPTVSVAELRAAIDYAERTWNVDERRQYAEAAARLYDFRATGKALDSAIAAHMTPEKVVA